MKDHSEIKRLAEAFPDYEWDSIQSPFFNGPSGESLGGESTGFYCVYGAPFEIDDETYDGITLVESCHKDQADFICEAKGAILELINEIEFLREESAKLNSDNKSMRGLIRKRHKQHQSRKQTLRHMAKKVEQK